jgi:hypothetical protein
MSGEETRLGVEEQDLFARIRFVRSQALYSMSA